MINPLNSAQINANGAKDASLIGKLRQKDGQRRSFDDTNFTEVLEAKRSQRPVDKKLMNTCVEMESILVGKMLKEMRSTLHKEESLLYGGMAEDIFEDMLYDEYALSMSKNSSMGLAKMLYNQLS